MNRIAGLTLALAAFVSGTAFAQDALTESQVRAQLTAQGYTNVNDVEFEDGVWKADARSADGNRMEVRINAESGEVYPSTQVAQLS